MDPETLLRALLDTLEGADSPEHAEAAVAALLAEVGGEEGGEGPRPDQPSGL